MAILNILLKDTIFFGFAALTEKWHPVRSVCRRGGLLGKIGRFSCHVDKKSASQHILVVNAAKPAYGLRSEAIEPEANRRLLPPAPSPREGVWGWGNVGGFIRLPERKKDTRVSECPFEWR